jgi:hypothetical protein
MATVPLSGTNIRLLSGVPFSNDYKNTRWFDDLTSQTTYFSSKNVVHSILEANFQRIEGKNFISVNKSIDELWGANYIMFQNAQYNNKWFYAFVTKLEYIQKKTTYVHFQIDVFQTWRFNMLFRPSFVVREHCKLWNEDGTPVINTVDEGLNYGSEYEIMNVDHYLPFGNIYFLVIVAKQTMHYDFNVPNEILPTLNGLPQPLCYYVHPFKMDGSSPGVSISGETMPISPILDVLKAIYKNTDAVNNVVSLYVTEHIGANLVYDAEWDDLQFPPDLFSNVLVHDGTNNFSTLFSFNNAYYAPITKTFTNKYSSYKTVNESKLLMYPYTALILDDLKGNRKVIKNEYIAGKDIEITVRGSMGTSNKVSYSILDYLNNPNMDIYQKLESAMEHTIINNNPNDIPIVTDMLSAYLQGNRNSLENQKNSIIFNGAMGAVGNTIGATASGLTGNAMGVASGGVGIIQGAGNTVLQLQGIEAKKQDIDNTPPSLAKMGGNTNFDYGNGISGLYIIKKQITQEYIGKLEHFFNMFGYKVNEVKAPNFHTRKYWNYVQTSSCYITGDFNNEDLQELKSVFDNGITFWHTDDVGNYWLNNEVIT